MLRVVSFFTLVACAFAAALHLSDTGIKGRIINGEDTTIQQHPYQVSLQLKGYKSIYEHKCGGSLISADFVVTAAHCVLYSNKLDISVYLGSSNCNVGGLRIQILEVTAHEDFDELTMANDVALLKLSNKVSKSPTTNYIPLALVTPTSNTPAVISGWGYTCFTGCSSAKVLQHADVNTISRSECNSISYRHSGDIRAGMICASGDNKDSCQGDSGGPLVFEGKLIGISSWGNGCADPAYPGVYSDVAYFNNWILKNMI